MERPSDEWAGDGSRRLGVPTRLLVGITATGEADANEFYPNDNMPPGMKAAEICLELYRQFRAKPHAFLLEKSL